MKSAIRLFLLCVLAALAACSASDDKSGRLLGADHDPGGEEADRISKKMAIRMISLETQDQPAGQIVELTPLDLSFGLLGECGERLQDNECKPKNPPVCSDARICQTALLLCGMQLRLAVAKDEPLDIVFQAPSSEHPTRRYKLLPQSTAAKVALASTAAEDAVLGFRQVMDDISSVAVSCDLDPNDSVPADTVQVREQALPKMAGQAVEFFYGLKEAQGILVRSVLAAADAERSSTNARWQKASRSQAQPGISRAALAHYIFNGEPGLRGSTGVGFCDADKPTGPSQTALGVFREAGVAPEDVLNRDLLTQDLLNGNLQRGSVRQRLSQFWSVSIANNVGIEEYYHLRVGDFDEARRYLGQELTAFGRSKSAQLPALIVNGAPLSYRRYVSTANPPPERDAAYFTALTLSDCGDKYCACASGTCAGQTKLGGNYATTPTPTALAGVGEPSRWRPPADTLPLAGTGMGIAAKLDYMLTRAEVALRGANASLPASAKDTVPPILERIQEHASERPARLTYCSGGPSPDEITLHGVAPSPNLLMVRGELGLEYLSHLSVEGAPPSGETALEAASSVVGSFDGTVPLSQVKAPFTTAARMTYASGVTIGQSPERWYVMQRAPNGLFAPLVGFVPYVHSTATTSTSTKKCRDIPIIPSLNRLVKVALEPSRAHCAISRIPCVADPNLSSFDERLPLEDELSADGDDFESSWKHYLALARQAADEADLLGKEYLNAAIDADRHLEDVELRRLGQEERAENKLQELQEICGTAIDPLLLVSFLNDAADRLEPGGLASGMVKDFSLGKYDLGSCSSDTDNDALTVCVAGRRILDWLQISTDLDPRLVQLSQCVGSMGNAERVHLGTVPVCVWPGSDGNLCSGRPSGQDCPDLAYNATADGPIAEWACRSPGGQIVNNGLAYFDTAETLPAGPGATMCGTIRALRQNPSDAEAKARLPELIDSGIFQPDQVPTVAFEARYFTHGAILQDESVLWQTGAPDRLPQTANWPCNTAVEAPSGCPVEVVNGTPRHTYCTFHDTRPVCANAGLFCQARDCTMADQRGDILDRIIRAVASAQLMRIKNKDRAPKMRLPVYLPANYKLPHPEKLVVVKGQGSSTSINEYSTSPPIFPAVIFPGKAYTVSGVAASDPATDAWVLVNGTKMNITTPPSGKVVAFVEGRIGSVRENDTAIVGYNSRGQWFSDLSTWHDKDIPEGYFAGVLKGHRAFADVGVNHFVYLPTLPYSDPFERVITSFDFKTSPGPLFDGLELLCEVATKQDSFVPGSCGEPPPEPKSIEELPSVSRFLDCTGRSIQRRGALTVFAGVPREAMDALRTQSPVGSHGAITGTLGVLYSELRGNLQEVAATAPGIGRELSGLARDVDNLRITVGIDENNKEIAQLQFWSTMANQIANCADSATSLAKNFSSLGAHVAITCANAVAQIHFASEINRLSQENEELGKKLAMNNFNERFANRVEALEGLAERLNRATEAVDGKLVEIQNARVGAQRILGEAIWLMSNEGKAQATVSAVLAKNKELAQARYQRAFSNAKRMAFLAERAISQRLGVDLKDMTEDLPLVSAPSTWESTVCERSGIDYATLQNGGDLSQVAEGFIGDYVTNLENLVESYRLKYNFHEGADTAVVSLRDDVHHVRAPCDTESTNLLYHSARLDQMSEVFTPESPSWIYEGCKTTTSGGQTFAMANCISARTADVNPFKSAALEQRSVPGFNLRFGDGTASCPAASTTCGYQAGAGLLQPITLDPGRYRFSWYTYEATPGTLAVTSAGTLTGSVRTVAGTELKPATFTLENNIVPGTVDTWPRVYFVFDVTTPTDVKVGFRSPNNQPQTILVAAPMLEKVTDTGPSVLLTPKAFSTTTDTRTIDLPICEDTTGDVFRAKEWHRECVKLCPDGFASECAGEDAQTACYRETSFNISQRSIEAGNAFIQAGFARGNFNYRIDSVALNFVGTGIRNCGNDPLTSTCNGAGYVTYSLDHRGPYFVRNHFGKDFEAKLFQGRIEHARGLGIERYLTNPLGTADSELITSYLRTELKGRPLDGNFVLRVWEEPGLNFDAIEDVQILLKYRYWTRFR